MYHPLGFLIFRDYKAGMVPSTCTLGMCRYISHSEIVCRGPKKFENPCSRQMTHLVALHRPGQQENCPKDGLAGSPHEQEEWTVRQERSAAVQAAHSPHDGLRVPRLEVRCPHPCPEVKGVTTQVSSHVMGAPWYLSNRQILEDLCVPLFADHSRGLTGSFDSRLADVGNPLFRKSADTYADRGLVPPPEA
jgi:hypothetical protein